MNGLLHCIFLHSKYVADLFAVHLVLKVEIYRPSKFTRTNWADLECTVVSAALTFAHYKNIEW